MAESAQTAHEETKPTRRVGRPRTRVLSKRLIVETGLHLLDTHGADGAGMRAIAKELGVRPSALYNHVAGQAELLAGIRELVSERIPNEMFDRLPWDEALIEWAHEYRLAFASHPPTIAVLAVLPLSVDSATSLMYEVVIDAMMRAGWPTARVLSVIVGLESFILGSALDLAAAEDMLDPGPRSDVPAFSAAYAARKELLADARRTTADEAFAAGLAAIMTGYRAEFSRVQAHSQAAHA